MGNWPTVGLSVALAFLFGYGPPACRCCGPGSRCGRGPVALAADTLSIATMEVIDNAIILTVPGAMESGLDSTLFWGSLAFALPVAGAVAYSRSTAGCSPAARGTPPCTARASTAGPLRGSSACWPRPRSGSAPSC